MGNSFLGGSNNLTSLGYLTGGGGGGAGKKTQLQSPPKWGKKSEVQPTTSQKATANLRVSSVGFNNTQTEFIEQEKILGPAIS